MRIKCYSVRLKSLTEISDKCYKAVSFDGSEALLPTSQYLGLDYSVSKSDAHWISAWILERKELQYSTKKEAWIDSATGKIYPKITVEHHIPAPITQNPNKDDSLLR